MQATLRLLSAAALVTSAALAQCPTLTSTTVGNNGQNGTMFEIHNISTAAMVINSFDQCFWQASTDDIEIYTMAGSCAGLELTPGAWTLAGSTTAFAHGIWPALDPVPITLSVTIPPGAVQSFYLTITNTANSVEYTTGSAQYGAVINSNADIEIIARTGMSYPFGSGFGLPTAGRLWNGTVHYCPAGGGTVFANATSYGQACVRQFGSFYEYFLPSTTIDLSNTSFQMVPSSGGYVVLPSSASYAPPSGTATNLALGDDSETTVNFLTAFNYPGGSTNALNVCSNGMISVGSNGTSYQPSVSSFLNWANPAWTVWRDFICVVGGGNVWSDDQGGVVTFTWDNVVGYTGTTQGTVPSSFNVIFDCNTGIVTFAFGSMDTVSLSTWTGGDGYIVGYSPAGASLDPGNSDLTTALPLVLTAGDSLGLGLAASGRPIQGTSINLTTSNLRPSTILGGLAFGLNNPNLALGQFGMNGCTQYADHVAVRLFFPSGAATFSVPYAVPVLPSALGLNIKTQSFAYDPASGLTTLGAVASQGVNLLIGDF
ncbi:MAG: hypothetical protein U1E73_09045 [Planctomycetota bacterium]